MKTTEIGRQFEEKAACLLKKEGYSIIERNFRCKYGEIDIIARKDDVIVFVEVKARSTPIYGFASEFVNKDKMRKLAKCINLFIQKHNLDGFDFRFDIIGFSDKQTQWIKNVFLEV